MFKYWISNWKQNSLIVFIALSIAGFLGSDMLSLAILAIGMAVITFLFDMYYYNER